MTDRQELAARFWKALGDDRTMMLGATGIAPRPMTAMAEDDRAPIWFFTASDTELAGQFLVEHVLLCLAGGVLSLATSDALLRWISAAGWVPYLDLSINWIVLLTGLCLTLLFAILSGVMPAWLMARAVPAAVLKGAA